MTDETMTIKKTAAYYGIGPHGAFAVTVKDMRDGLAPNKFPGHWDDIAVLDATGLEVGTFDANGTFTPCSGLHGPERPLSADRRGEIIAILAGIGAPGAGPTGERIAAAIAVAQARDWREDD